MATLRAFSRRMAAIADEVEENAAKVLRFGVLRIERNLVLATPVDVGRARSNWLVGVNRPDRSDVRPTSAGATIARAVSRLGAVAADDTVYLSNNLPYINRLNEGHSQQAPPGYIEKAVEDGAGFIRQQRLLDD